MPERTRLYTTAEVAALSGVAISVVYNAIGKKLIRTAVPAGYRAASGSLRRVNAEGILRLMLWHHTGLGRDQLGDLFDAMRALPEADKISISEFLTVDVGKARRLVSGRLRDLEASEAAIVEDKRIFDGEAVFRGTQISVRSVVGMLDKGKSQDVVLATYPGLTPHQLTLAQFWASANPLKGRPKTSRSPKPEQREGATGSSSAHIKQLDATAASNALNQDCPISKV